jgi:hypothetical protein
MSFPKRETIAIGGAIVGATLVSLLTRPQPAQSSSCLQWAADAWDGYSYQVNRAIHPPRVPEGLTEGEYNQYREIFKTDDIRVLKPQSQAAPVPVSALPRTVARVETPPPVSATPSVTGDPALAAQVAAVDRAVDNGTYQAAQGGY